MSNQIKDLDRLADISRFCSLILEKRQEVTWEEFDEDETVRWALVKWLEMIGEAAYSLSDETTEEFAEVNWRAIITARDVYVHHYYNLVWQRVWKTIVETDFAALKDSVEKIIRVLRARF